MGKIDISKDILETLYFKEKLSIIKIAEKLNYGETTIRRRFNEFNIQKRSFSDACNIGQTGRKLSDETKKKIGESHKGEKSKNWRGGITNEMENRKDTMKWRKLRKDIIKKQGNICEICNKIPENKNCDCAHILHPEDYQDIYNELAYSKCNIAVLCNSCHCRLDKNTIRGCGICV